MKYKDLKGYLIAIDLDGTLLTGFDNYDKKSFELLKEISKNNFIVISTGRPYRSSKYYYDLLDLKTPLVNYNGAFLHNPSDPNFKKRNIYIDKDKLIKFIDAEKDILENIFCEIEDNIYVQKLDDYIEPYLHVDGGVLHVCNFKDTLPDNPNGAILFVKIGQEQRLEKYVKDVYQGEVILRYWFTNTTTVCEFYNPKTSKANALKAICDYYNIDYSKTIAIGDGHNDIEMLEFANIAVAMGNGHKDLLPHADIITDDVLNNGVYKFFMMDIKE